MTNFLPNQDVREPNYSVLVAAYYILQRQSWKSLAVRTWATMKRFLLLTVFAGSLAALMLPAIAHARTYDVMTADVPFKFSIGDRAFGPGRYDLIFVGPGLMVLRDSHTHIIGSFVTRSRESNGPSPVSKIVFDKHNKRPQQLAEIWIENRAQVIDVLGQQLAMRPDAPPPAAFSPPINSLFDRREAPGMKH